MGSREVYDLLNDFKTRQGIRSDAQLGRHVGVHQSIIGKYRDGLADPKIETLRRIAAKTDISLKTLLVAAELCTMEELEMEVPATDPRDLSNDALLRLVRERMVEPSRPDDLAAHEPAGSRAGDPELTGRHLPRLVQPANGTGNSD